MLLPFETSFSIWFTGIPQYSWDPIPVPEPDPNAAALTAGSVTASTESCTPPPLRLVFRGVDWTVSHSCWSQANPAWDLSARNERHEDEEQVDERLRLAQKPPPPAESGS